LKFTKINVKEMIQMIGKRLKALRKEIDITQSELANRLDVSQRTIAYYESDEKNPEYEKLQPYRKKLKAAAKVSQYWFFQDAANTKLGKVTKVSSRSLLIDFEVFVYLDESDEFGCMMWEK
jgi:transcriptional regulator with XRE-family HTH domain